MAIPVSSRSGFSTIPFLRGLLILLWGISLELLIWNPRVGLWITGGLTVTIIGIVTRWASRMPRWARGILVLWVAAASVITLLVADGPLTRQLMVILSLIALTMTLMSESHFDNPVMHGRVAAVTILFVLMGSYFSLLTFSTGIYIAVKPWWLAVAAGVVTSGLSALGWSAADVPFQKYARVLPLAAIFGAELFFATWWLPTAIYVGSIIASTITILWIQTVRHIWLGDWEPGRGRRYVAIGASVVVAILITARWF